MIKLRSDYNNAVTEYADLQTAQDAIMKQAEEIGRPLKMEVTPHTTAFGYDFAGGTLWWRVER